MDRHRKSAPAIVEPGRTFHVRCIDNKPGRADVAATLMAKPSVKRIVAVHQWRGELVRVELSCGHFHEKSKARIPKSNKLTCADCAPITVNRTDAQKLFDNLRGLQAERSEDASDAIGDCIEELKKLFGDGF